jgi:hypothetical protein
LGIEFKKSSISCVGFQKSFGEVISNVSLKQKIENNIYNKRKSCHDMYKAAFWGFWF